MVLEDMAAAFIKLGQILSSRPDLLPPEYQVELAKLQDAAPTVPTDVVRKIVAAEFGQPIECVFASFGSEPLAAASIGQAQPALTRAFGDVLAG